MVVRYSKHIDQERLAREANKTDCKKAGFQIVKSENHLLDLIRELDLPALTAR